MPYPAKTNREAILAVAIDQLARDGMQGLSLRAIAAALDLAPNALYRYYADRDVLMAAIADEGARRLLVSLREAVGVATGVEAIHILAQKYLDFARAHPELYQVVMTKHEALAGRSTAYDELWPFVVGVLRPIAGERNAPQAAVVLWSFLHGIFEIEVADLFHEGKPRDGVTFGLEAFLGGIQRPSS